MKIRKFIGKSINGYLDIEVPFYDDLTFVTGINGSGKTTALNATISLLMPRLDFLCSQDYKELSLTLEHEKKVSTLSARRTPNGAVISVDGDNKAELEILAFNWDETATPTRNREMEQSFFREQISRYAPHAVIQFIQNLPTPMFLGLDRRSVSQDDSVHRYAPRPYSYTKSARRNIFAPSLSQSLLEALTYTFEKFREEQREKARLDERLRREMLLDLIDFAPIAFPGRLEMPSQEEINQIEASIQNLKKLPELLGTSEEKIAEKLKPFIEFFEGNKSAIEKVKKAKRSKDRESEIEIMLAWTVNRSHLEKIAAVSNRIAKYNQSSERLFRETRGFLSTLDLFFADSGKTIKFDNFGDLHFHRKDDPTSYDLRSLSSGEIQLVVILAHLHFNPEVRKAGIFIIDEPELSLHVEWQEKFVESIIGASKSTQFVLATHSPSIILDRTDACVDLTPRKR